MPKPQFEPQLIVNSPTKQVIEELLKNSDELSENQNQDIESQNSENIDLSDVDTGMIMDSTSKNVAIKNNQIPSELLSRLRKQKQLVREFKKIGRNEKCPCGSGKKYKNCCMNTGKYECLVEKK